jgi:hypothetical protein
MGVSSPNAAISRACSAVPEKASPSGNTAVRLWTMSLSSTGRIACVASSAKFCTSSIAPAKAPPARIDRATLVENNFPDNRASRDVSLPG